jgi:hypothetical protein
VAGGGDAVVEATGVSLAPHRLAPPLQADKPKAAAISAAARRLVTTFN